MEKLIIKGIILGFGLLLAGSCFSQGVKYSSWEIRFSKDKFIKDDTVTIYFIGKIPENQGVYSTKFKCDYGPKLTRINYINQGKDYTVIDSAISVNDTAAFDEIFECYLRKFKGIAIIKQVIKIKNDNAKIKGKMEYQTCTDDQCLPFSMYFETKGTKVLKVENGK